MLSHRDYPAFEVLVQGDFMNTIVRDDSTKKLKAEELISVLVPLYNVELFVHKCIDSVFSQTYQNLEFIFINDDSTDNTKNVLEQLLKKFPNKATSVKFVNNEKNYGISSVRKIALSLALGEYIFFVDGDDFIERDAIARLYQKQQNTGADIVVGDFFVEYEDYKVVYTHQKDLSSEEYFLGLIKRTIPCCIWGKLIRRDLFLKNRIRMVDRVQLGEDFAIMTQLSYLTQKITFLGHPVYHYRKTNQQSIMMNLSEQSIDDLLKVNDVLFNVFGENQEINNQIKLYTKLLFFKQLPTIDLLKMASRIYPETTIPQSLRIKDRLVLTLADRSHFWLLHNLYQIYCGLRGIWNFIICSKGH